MAEKAYRANKSGEVFYVTESGDKVALRNPLTGLVKEVKGSTLKRSYTPLTEEELKEVAAQTVNTNHKEEKKMAEKTMGFESLMQCESRADFEAALQEQLTEVEGVAEIETLEEAKKVRGNASLCFKENMDRYIKAKADYESAKASYEANESDLDVAKSYETAQNALQKYTDKMIAYLSKAEAAKARVQELTPEKEDTPADAE